MKRLLLISLVIVATGLVLYYTPVIGVIVIGTIIGVAVVRGINNVTQK